MASREFWDEQFEQLANNPLAWQRSARDLISTANTARRQIEARIAAERADWKVHGGGRTIVSIGAARPVAPILMLYALAAENLAKAVLIATGTQATAKRRLATELRSHDIPKLLRAMGLQMDEGSIEFAEKLERHVFSGRYPVQTQPNDRPYADGISIPQDFDWAIALLERLEVALELSAPGRVDPKCNLADI
jgi:hypothetical protein